MSIVRLLLAQRYLVVLLCAATLALKLVVPTGYMIDNDRGRIAITICPGVTPGSMPKAETGMHGTMPDHGKSNDHSKPEMPCAFSSLSAAALSAADPLQLIALLAFVMALWLGGFVLPAQSRPAYLRPPLRGPPAYL